MKKKISGKIIFPKPKLSSFNKILLTMKLTLLLTTLISFQLSATVLSQKIVLDQRIKGQTVRKTLSIIEQKSNARFFYNDDYKQLNDIVSNDIEEGTLDEMLTKVLGDALLSYKVLDNNFVVVFPQGAIQQKQVTGAVTDAVTGEPLPGVNIIVEGTSNGVITNMDGNYTIEIPNENSTLVFSYVGYLKKKVAVADNNVIDVQLYQDVQKLDEVVVIGYGTQRKGDVTSSIATVKPDEFTKGSVTDAGQLIQGKVAGLSIISPSGDPTASTQILLRGQTTLMGANQSPLVLIDGVPGDINTVAPQDIESIDVLKDGSAAAIYGTRGTNGVIIITTKRASGNYESTVEYSVYASTQTIARKLDLSTASDFRNQIAAGYRSEQTDLGANTNWLDEITRTPLSQVHNLTVRGGNSTTNYLVNLNYNNTEGIFLKSYNQVFQGRADFNHNMFNDKVKININLFNSSTKLNGFNGYIYRQSVIQNPTAPVKNEDGTWFQELTKFEYENPVSDLMESNGVNNQQNSRYKGSVTYTPIKGLKLSSVFSYSKRNLDRGYSETKQHISTLRDGRNGYAEVSGSMWIERLADLTAEYDKSFGKNNFVFLGGYSYQENEYRTHFMNNWDFPTDLFGFSAIEKGNAIKDGLASQTSYQNKTNLIGFFTRVTYNYDQRYLFMGSLRHEAASQLWGTDNPWGTFPAVSVGWRITNEPFMKDQGLFNDIKLRAGYGVTGSQPSDLFLGVALLDYDRYVLSDGKWLQTLVPSQNPNPNLRWEEKRETNFGVDFSMLNNRVGGSIDYYIRNIKDLLFNYAVPSPPNLYDHTIANVGKMENKGLEVVLNLIPVKSNNFEWSSSLNFSTNSNKLVSLSNDIYKTSSDYFTVGYTGPPVQTFTHLVKIGGKVGDFYGFKVVDIGNDPADQANYGQWVYEGSDGQPVKYSDFGHSFEDKQVIGNGLPKYYAGWNNTFRFKNWDLSISQRGAFKFQIANFQRMMYENPTYTQYNLLRSAFDKVYGKTQLKSPHEFNSYYIEQGDYWKIDNITLGYNFKNIKLKYIQSARVYVSSLNTFIITGYSGIDPEVSLRNGVSNAQSGINVIPTSGLDPGIDWRDKYPTTRTFSVGLNVSF